MLFYNNNHIRYNRERRILPCCSAGNWIVWNRIKCSNSSNNYKYDIRRNFKRYIGHMDNRQVEFNKANNYSFTDLFNSYISCCLLSVLDAAQCNFDFDLLQCFYYNIFLYMAYIIYQNKNYNKKNKHQAISKQRQPD